MRRGFRISGPGRLRRGSRLPACWRHTPHHISDVVGDQQSAEAIDRHSDRSWGMERIEITCKNCGGHLGHVFKGEGFNTPTNERHCVNSVSINFDKDDAKI